MTVGLLLILLAAWRSEGFLNADEHFQTLEFAGSKLGRTPVSALPWEYHERMRPWLQPGLYTMAARALAALGVDDPFRWAFAFRLFSGLMAWLGLVGLSLCADRWFANARARRLAVRAMVLLYFVPVLAVRTSCESLSTSCFVLALCLVVLGDGVPGPGPALLAGALLGLSFGLRYAAGVLVASLLAWMALVGRTPARTLACVALGIASALVAGLLVDRWGYGQWTLAPWNYASQNFGADRAAVEFGAQPWYGYLPILVRGPFGLLHVLLGAAVVMAWVRHPRHVLTWSTAPLAFVHCAIAHKELRFLFPIAMLAAPLLVLAIGAFPRSRWERWVVGGLLAYDLVGLAASCLLPLQPIIPFQRFATPRLRDGREAFVSSSGSPWAWRGLRTYFYAPPPPGLQPWPGAADMVAAGRERFFLLTSSWEVPPPVAPYVCQPLYRSVPEWLARRGWPVRRWAAPAAWDLSRCRLPVVEGVGRLRAPPR
jgi:hypothetical protein